MSVVAMVPTAYSPHSKWNASKVATSIRFPACSLRVRTIVLYAQKQKIIFGCSMHVTHTHIRVSMPRASLLYISIRVFISIAYYSIPSRNSKPKCRDRFLFPLSASLRCWFCVFLLEMSSLVSTILYGRRRWEASAAAAASVREAACHLKSVGAEAIELDIVFHKKSENGNARTQFSSLRFVWQFILCAVERGASSP